MGGTKSFPPHIIQYEAVYHNSFTSSAHHLLPLINHKICMFRERNETVMHELRNPIPTVVDITNPGYHALIGSYFIGQTGELNFGNGYDAWGGLINPKNSGVNLFFDIFTITNFSSQSYTAEIWLNAIIPEDSIISNTVTPSNQGIIPPPKPKAFMKYSDDVTETFEKGVNIFDRIVTPNSTLVSDSHQGSIIIGPGNSFSILLKSPNHQIITGTIVLTWWEEKIQTHRSHHR